MLLAGTTEGSTFVTAESPAVGSHPSPPRRSLVPSGTYLKKIAEVLAAEIRFQTARER